MYVCQLTHKNGKVGELHRVNSFQWRLKFEKGVDMVGGNEILDYIIKDVKSGILTVTDNNLPKVIN